MSLPEVATTDEVETTRAWIRNFYEGINFPDINSWVTDFYKPDAILNYGNSPSLKGLKEIADHFEKERVILSNIKHFLLHVDVFSDRIYVQKKDIFIVKNDPEQKEIIIKLLVVIWKKVDEDKLSSLDYYLDPTPLLERIKMFPSK